MNVIETTELTHLDDAVNVIGIVVSCHPKTLPDTKAALTRLTGVEIHGQNEHGQLVVTIEEPDEQKSLIDTYQTISAYPNILATSLVFSHSDDGLDFN